MVRGQTSASSWTVVASTHNNQHRVTPTTTSLSRCWPIIIFHYSSNTVHQRSSRGLPSRIVHDTAIASTRGVNYVPSPTALHWHSRYLAVAEQRRGRIVNARSLSFFFLSSYLPIYILTTSFALPPSVFLSQDRNPLSRDANIRSNSNVCSDSPPARDLPISSHRCEIEGRQMRRGGMRNRLQHRTYNRFERHLQTGIRRSATMDRTRDSYRYE